MLYVEGHAYIMYIQTVVSVSQTNTNLGQCIVLVHGSINMSSKVLVLTIQQLYQHVIKSTHPHHTIAVSTCHQKYSSSPYNSCINMSSKVLVLTIQQLYQHVIKSTRPHYTIAVSTCHQKYSPYNSCNLISQLKKCYILIIYTIYKKLSNSIVQNVMALQKDNGYTLAYYNC